MRTDVKFGEDTKLSETIGHSAITKTIVQIYAQIHSITFEEIPIFTILLQIHLFRILLK